MELQKIHRLEHPFTYVPRSNDGAEYMESFMPCISSTHVSRPNAPRGVDERINVSVLCYHVGTQKCIDYILHLTSALLRESYA